MKLKKAMKYDIHIEPSVNNRYIATLGCAKFVYTEINELLADIESYLKDPDGHENMFFKVFGDVPPDRLEEPVRQTLGCV